MLLFYSEEMTGWHHINGALLSRHKCLASAKVSRYLSHMNVWMAGRTLLVAHSLRPALPCHWLMARAESQSRHGIARRRGTADRARQRRPRQIRALRLFCPPVNNEKFKAKLKPKTIDQRPENEKQGLLVRF